MSYLLTLINEESAYNDDNYRKFIDHLPDDAFEVFSSENNVQSVFLYSADFFDESIAFGYDGKCGVEAFEIETLKVFAELRQKRVFNRDRVRNRTETGNVLDMVRLYTQLANDPNSTLDKIAQLHDISGFSEKSFFAQNVASYRPALHVQLLTEGYTLQAKEYKGLELLPRRSSVYKATESVNK